MSLSIRGRTEKWGKSLQLAVADSARRVDVEHGKIERP
jgi:hypothetical protein